MKVLLEEQGARAPQNTPQESDNSPEKSEPLLMVEIFEQRRLQLAFKSGRTSRGAFHLALESKGSSVGADGQLGDYSVDAIEPQPAPWTQREFLAGR